MRNFCFSERSLFRRKSKGCFECSKRQRSITNSRQRMNEFFRRISLSSHKNKTAISSNVSLNSQKGNGVWELFDLPRS